MYSQLMAEKENGEKSETRIVFPPHINSRWKEFCRRKGVTQQGAIERLIEFVLDQDDVYQSMILRQVEATQDLASVVLKRIAKKGRRGDNPDKK